jgi:cell division protein FtsZ
MGGGTGSGAAPVIAEIAKTQCGCLTVGIVTKPFAFEGKKRIEQAERAIDELRKVVDTLIVVSNDKLLQIIPENTPVTDAFLVADDILRQGVVGISDIIVKTGLVNVDFADVRAVMSNAGTAIIGVGKGTGRNRATDAAIAAISSPLLDYPIHKAKRIVFNIVGGTDMGLQEINEASEVIYDNADDNANIIFGALVDPTMSSGEISITVLACDFDTSNLVPKRKLVSSTASQTTAKTSTNSDTAAAAATTTIEPPSRLFSSSATTTTSIPDDVVAIPQQQMSTVMSTTKTATETKPFQIPPPPRPMKPNSTIKAFPSKGGFKRPQRKKVGILRRLWSMLF